MFDKLLTTCPTCNGDRREYIETTRGGYDPDTWQEDYVSERDCETCNGSGEVVAQDFEFDC